MTIVPEVDEALPLGMLLWVLAQLDREQLPLVLESASEGVWQGERVAGRQIAPEVCRAGAAWIVQRPGCAGLVTRVVLCDLDGEPIAAVAAARAPGDPEPSTFRVLLLLALLAREPVEEASWAAK